MQNLTNEPAYWILDQGDYSADNLKNIFTPA